MRTRSLITAAVAATVALAGCDDPARPGLEDGTRQAVDDALLAQGRADLIPDHYIVVLDDGVTDPPGVARGLARAHGLELRHTYAHALKGFAAVVPPGRVDAIRADRRVRYVTADRTDRVHQQSLPTGIDRIEVEQHLAATAGAPYPVEDVDIAILDTGIDLDHPDLNVFRSVSFAGNNPDDGMGHGSHVAGTAAAKNDGVGVVGVAPGARLWAVKVCNNGGSCSRSDIIAGIDYVAQNAADIEVANMSLGGVGEDDGNCGETIGDPEHTAICAAVDSGVVFVVSAGNRNTDAANSVPAAYDQVLTVSALADFDGTPGGLVRPGEETCRSDEDDSFAAFSNHGPDVDVMAPGVCIESTWKQGGYNTISGTSMAAPHVTGTVALYIAKNGRDADLDGDVDADDVALIRTAVVEAGIPQIHPCGLSVLDDPDGIREPIIFANAPEVGGDDGCGAGVPPADADIAVAGVSAPASAAPGALIEVTVTVVNHGPDAVTSDIPVFLVSDNTTADPADDITIGYQTVDGGLGAGSTADLVFEWNTFGAATGTHTLTATYGLTDGNAGNDTGTTSVSLEGVAAPTVHVGDLERASDPPEKGKWAAHVRITVHDGDENLVPGVTVSGTWTSPSGSGSCVTDSDGRCVVSFTGLSRGSEIWVWFTVDALTVDGKAYNPLANHDPDGNSDGTSIQVFNENDDDYDPAAR